MVTLELSIDIRVFQRIQVRMQQAPEIMDDYIEQVIFPFVDKQVQGLLRKEPGPVKYPIQWTTDKQRRAFFATNGFGAGIPYVRKHTLAPAWNVTLDFGKAGTGVVIQNLMNAAEYVYGKRQQGFHVTTGWPNAYRQMATIATRTAPFFNQMWQV
jgi:hypothetical protein